MTITPFTNRYGASLRRNFATGSAFQRRNSSGVGPAAVASSFVDCEAYDGVDERVVAGMAGGGVGVEAGALERSERGRCRAP